MRVVQILIDTVVQAGVSRAAFLQAAELDSESLQEPEARLPRASLYDLTELALELTTDPAFGLHAVERLLGAAFSSSEAPVVHSETLQQSLSSVDEFRHLLGDQGSFQLYEEREKVIVRVHGVTDRRPAVRRFWTEVTLAGLYATVRRYGVASQIDSVDFQYGAPEYQQDYARIFDGRARFDQPFTGLCFDRGLRSAAGPQPEAGLHAVLRALATGRLTQLNDGKSYADRVHQHLLWQRSPRDVRMETTARALGVSVRSLRRYLTAEGKRYPELVSEVLAIIAKTCLLEEHRTIVDTAAELGFSHHTGFHRAFKRWTGVTPGAATGQGRSGSREAPSSGAVKPP